MVFDTGSSAVCATAPFAVAAGGNSGVIDLDLYWYSASEGATALIYPCSPPDPEAATFSHPLPAAPAAGRVELRIAGVLDDATPFEATAATTLP